jgi:hypothetical protein
MHKNLVKLTPFDCIGDDQRGVTKKKSFSRSQSDFIYLTRNSGSISGNTYYLGKNSGTNPKIFILLSGATKFYYREIGTNQVIVDTVESPCLIKVSPRVINKVEALSDMQILECNSIKDIQNDRVREDIVLESTII